MLSGGPGLFILELLSLRVNLNPRHVSALPQQLPASILERVASLWHRLSRTEKQYLVAISVAIATSYYILAPTLFPHKQMFTKRPDKHTTGLINLRNDCFANSSLQAYLSLPGLTEYLNKFVGSYHVIKRLAPNSHIEQTIEKDAAKRGVPLHEALARIMKKLQDTQLTSRTISVWTFLHTLETIFHAKISRSQHDAHELTQLINETLENENIRVQSILKKLLETKEGDQDAIGDEVREQLYGLEIPEFPFSGLTLNQMVCLSCKHVSMPSFVPFLMLTLNTPQSTSTDLKEILDENESETIEGYQCLKCRVAKIVANEKHLQSDPAGTFEAEALAKIAELDANPLVCINEDLPKDLEEYIKSYSKPGLDISKVTTTVLRKHQILKPPKIFGIHLARSNFDGVSVTRNACRVTFKDHLTLSIGKEYYNELQKFQEESNTRRVAEETNIKSKVLTTDVDDMEDADVQVEDIDEKGGDDDDDDITSCSATETDGDNLTEKEDDNDTDDTDEIDADDDSDSSSLTSHESVGESVGTSATLKGSLTGTGETLIMSKPLKTRASKATETLNNAPITEDQTDDLKEHFKSFKFNDNDVYKYRLKALVKHQGSHSQGHYECYKRKPLFVKDSEGTIFKLSPEIDDDATGDRSYSVSVEAGNDNKTRSNSGENGNDGEASEEHLKFLEAVENGEIKGTGGRQFRRKFSNIMGRRPSVLQAHATDADIQEIIHSGSQTPAELLVDNPQDDYFGNFREPFNANGQKQESQPSHHRVKMTKIPSLIKNPYWRISDSQITEVSKAAVLYETASVYMLYYERVDRKQIKGRR